MTKGRTAVRVAKGIGLAALALLWLAVLHDVAPNQRISQSMIVPSTVGGIVLCSIMGGFILAGAVDGYRRFRPQAQVRSLDPPEGMWTVLLMIFALMGPQVIMMVVSEWCRWSFETGGYPGARLQ